MERAFIVKVNVDDGDNLRAIADDMMDVLSLDYDVTAVDPWDSPGSAAPVAPAAPTTFPTF